MVLHFSRENLLINGDGIFDVELESRLKEEFGREFLTNKYHLNEYEVLEG